MAEQALSTIGVVFGWGLGTMTEAPESWKQIEEPKEQEEDEEA